MPLTDGAQRAWERHVQIEGVNERSIARRAGCYRKALFPKNGNRWQKTVLNRQFYEIKFYDDC